MRILSRSERFAWNLGLIELVVVWPTIQAHVVVVHISVFGSLNSNVRIVVKYNCKEVEANKIAVTNEWASLYLA